MKLSAGHIFIILTLIASISAYADGTVKISAQVDSSKDIYTGEDFTYYIIIEGAEKAGQVDMTPLMQFNPQHIGNRQQSSTQIINNRVTITKTIIMTYSLRSGSAGRINLPSLDVNLDGKNYKQEIDFKRNNELHFFIVKIMPTAFEDGRQGVTMILKNNTDRKIAENVLRESEENFRNLLKKMSKK